MNICLFCRQFRVLAWKNALIKWRHCTVLIVELAIPVLILIALGGLKSIFKPSITKESIPNFYYPSSGTFSTFEAQYIPPACFSANLVWSCLQSTYPKFCNYSPEGKGCKRQYIAVAPSQPSVHSTAASFVSWMTDQSSLAKEFSSFVLFNSESDLTKYIEDPNYGTTPKGKIYSSAIIFNSGAPTWDYTLRMNRTYYPTEYGGGTALNPETSIANVDITVPTNEAGNNDGPPYLEAYLQTGQMTLSDLINSFIASVTCEKKKYCSGGGTFAVNTLGGVEFPSPQYAQSGFWSNLGQLFAFLIVISILYPLVNVIRALIQEKESKTREGMMMMAMRGDSLYMSWIFNFLCLFLPLAILMTIAGGINLFLYSNGALIFFYWILFFMSSVSYCFFVSIFFNKALTGV